MIDLVKAWIVLTFLRIIDALGWPWWLLCLIGLVVVPIAVARTYFW